MYRAIESLRSPFAWTVLVIITALTLLGTCLLGNSQHVPSLLVPLNANPGQLAGELYSQVVLVLGTELKNDGRTVFAYSHRDDQARIYECYLKLPMSETEFRQVISTGIWQTAKTSESEYATMQSRWGRVPGYFQAVWWDPSPATSTDYIRVMDELFGVVFLKYESGFCYVEAHAEAW